MNAVLARRYGGPEALTLEDVDRPEPEASQVPVEVHVAATNPSYWHRMEGKVPMLRQAYGELEPTDPAMGGDCAGTAVAVGSDVTRFAVGDAGLLGSQGGLRRISPSRQSGISPKPENVPFVDAAAIPTGGLTALQGLRDHGQRRRPR